MSLIDAMRRRAANPGTQIATRLARLTARRTLGGSSEPADMRQGAEIASDVNSALIQAMSLMGAIAQRFPSVDAVSTAGARELGAYKDWLDRLAAGLKEASDRASLLDRAVNAKALGRDPSVGACYAGFEIVEPGGMGG